MIKAIAIDDELPALKILEIFCGKMENISLEHSFNKPTEALKYITKFPVDLVFLDVNMPSLNGIELAKSIRQNTKIIFTTAFSEYALDGFNLNAVDFLLKPFTFGRFSQAVNKVSRYFDFSENSSIKQAPDSIYVRANYRLMRVETANIVCIESVDDYLKIHLQDQKPLLVRMTIKSIQEKLPPANFLRVHRSFIVALDKISSIKGKLISIGGQEIPVSGTYEQDFFKWVNRRTNPKSSTE